MKDIYIGDTLIDPVNGRVKVKDVDSNYNVVLETKNGVTYTRSVHFIESFHRIKGDSSFDVGLKTIVSTIAFALITVGVFYVTK